MNPRDTSTDSTDSTDSTRRTDLRTVEPHYSAAQEYAALDCPYTGTDVLRMKERQRARASIERAQSLNKGSGNATTATGDRRGESGVSL